VVFLGVENDGANSPEKGVGWFALDATTVSVENVHASQPDAVKIAIPLGLMQLSRSEGAIAGQGRSMLAWHARNKFCSTCGTGSVLKDAGYKRECMKKDCASNKGNCVSNICPGGRKSR